MPDKFIQPRRFSEIFQMAEDWPGTLGQQVAVREALAVEFGSNQHKLLQKVDRWINRPQWGQTHIPIAFVDLDGILGRGFANGILLSQLLKPAYIDNVVLHEFGHTYERLDLLTDEDRLWFMAELSWGEPDWRLHWEAFADAFRDVWLGVGWTQLWSRLLR